MRGQMALQRRAGQPCGQRSARASMPSRPATAPLRCHRRGAGRRRAASASKSTCAVRSACPGMRPAGRQSACARSACNVSPARPPAAIVDESGQPAKRPQCGWRSALMTGAAGGADLDHLSRRALSASAVLQRGTGKRVGQAKGQLPVPQADQPLRASLRPSRLNWRIGRASKNSLAIRNSGCSRQVLGRVQPARRGSRRAGVCPCTARKRGRGFDQHHLCRRMKPRHRARWRAAHRPSACRAPAPARPA